MKTIVATFSMFIFSIFFNIPIVEEQCGHCQYIKKYEKLNFNSGIATYVHDVDSNLVIYPIIDTILGKSYIQSIKFDYKDLHYCSDLTKITFITNDTSFSLLSERRMSCKISSLININTDQYKILKTIPVKSLVIENLVTDNVYYYNIDSLYFINTLKLTNNSSILKKHKHYPEKSGYVK